MSTRAADPLNTEGTGQLHTSKPCTNTFPKLPLYYRKLLFGFPRHQHVHEHAIAQKCSFLGTPHRELEWREVNQGGAIFKNIEMVSKFAWPIGIKKSRREGLK